MSKTNIITNLSAIVYTLNIIYNIFQDLFEACTPGATKEQKFKP